MAIFFLCSQCKKACKNNTLQCSECLQWTHSSCVPLSKSGLASWTKRSMQFVCRSCAFHGDYYNAIKALERLELALKSPKENDFSNQAWSEQKCIETYKVSLPKTTPLDENCEYAISSSMIDTESVKILNMFNPIINTESVPLKAVGDGNCLYRAVSLGVFGTQQHHTQLRLLTTLELAQHSYFYDVKRKNNALLYDVRVVTSDVSKLIRDAVTLGAYSEMAHLQVLSTVLGVPIRSFYPPQRIPDISNAFTRKVVGRSVSADIPALCEIMWTSMNAPLVPNDFTVNHFVPLVSKKIVLSDCDESDMFDCFNSTAIGNSTENSVFKCDTMFEEVTSVSSIEHESNMSKVQEESVGVTFENSQVGSDSGTSFQDVVYGSSLEQENDVSTVQGETENTTIESNCFSSLEEGLYGKLIGGFLGIDTIISMLLEKRNGLKHIPAGVKEEVYFVLDNVSNVEKRGRKQRSDFSDDCGVWASSSGSSPKTYFVLEETGALKSVIYKTGVIGKNKKQNRTKEFIPLVPQPDPDKIVVVQRNYSSLKANHLYKKRVTWLGDSGVQSTLAIVEYTGKYPGLGPYGDGNAIKEYTRCPGYVMNEITELTSKLKPHQIYNTLKAKYDETTRPSRLRVIHNKQSRQRSKPQHNIYSTNIADQFKQLENMVSEKHPFVRYTFTSSGRPPCIIFYDDSQMTDIRNLCCTGQTVLGIDKTFMLCKLHVTVTCYKQLSVTRQTSDAAPVFIGPMFVHDNSDSETYSYFFYHLKLKLADTNTSKLVIGTDDEKAMVKAITSNFPEATHVLCTRHLKQNARQKLTDDAVNLKDRTKILNQVFGPDGIVCADDSICFNDRCAEFEHSCSHISDKFVSYFQTRLKPILKEKVNGPVRHGLVGPDWTNNNCESINHVLKQTVDWKSKGLTEFAKLAQDLVDGQTAELKSALIGTGDFRVAKSHSQFKRTKTEWLSMTLPQRQNLFRKFRQYKVTNSRLVISNDGLSTVVAPRTDGKKPGTRKRKVNVRTTNVTKRQRFEHDYATDA